MPQTSSIVILLRVFLICYIILRLYFYPICDDDDWIVRGGAGRSVTCSWNTCVCVYVCVCTYSFIINTMLVVCEGYWCRGAQMYANFETRFVLQNIRHFLNLTTAPKYLSRLSIFVTICDDDTCIGVYFRPEIIMKLILTAAAAAWRGVIINVKITSI